MTYLSNFFGNIGGADILCLTCFVWRKYALGVMRNASTKAQPKRYQTLHSALQAEGMNQRQLAKLIGKSEAYVSNILAGRFRPSLVVAARIQRVLNVDIGAMV